MNMVGRVSVVSPDSELASELAHWNPQLLRVEGLALRSYTP